ncbi:MAG: endonuclease/exonuclease/phosphatase family protein [bacterium]
MPAQTIHIPGPTPTPIRRRRGAAVLALFTQIYMAAVLLALYLARNDLDLEPLRFAVILGPRVAFLAPLVLLLPWALLGRHRWMTIELLLALALVAGPLMGLETAGLLADRSPGANSAGSTIRMVTYNIGPDSIRVDDFLAWMEQENVELLAIQEDSSRTELSEKLRARGWSQSRYGYLFTKDPIVAESDELPAEFGGNRIYPGHLNLVQVRKNDAEFFFGTAHGPSLRGAFHNYADHFDNDELSKTLRWQQRQMQRIAAMMDANDNLPLVVGGDFNVPPGSIYAMPLEKRFKDAFIETGSGYGFTFPTKFPWLRLDRFYHSRGFRPLRTKVGPNFGSDHLPVFAEMEFTER